MFYQTFLSPQVKRCAIITDKDEMYQFPYELPNSLRLSIIECPHTHKKDLGSQDPCMQPDPRTQPHTPNTRTTPAPIQEKKDLGT